MVLLSLVHMPPAPPPKAEMPPIAATAISATISPYSIAVAPALVGEQPAKILPDSVHATLLWSTSTGPS